MEDYFVVCVPEAWDHTADSTQERCIECDSVVWVSVSGMKVALDNDADFICIFCANQWDGDVEVMPPTQGQVTAIQDNIQKQADKN